MALLPPSVNGAVAAIGTAESNGLVDTNGSIAYDRGMIQPADVALDSDVSPGVREGVRRVIADVLMQLEHGDAATHAIEDMEHDRRRLTPVCEYLRRAGYDVRVENRSAVIPGDYDRPSSAETGRYHVHVKRR